MFGRRHDEAHTLEAEAAYAIFKGLVEFYAGTEMSARFTNFPDYTPYTFPARRAYSLDRDVRLFTAYLGLRVQM